MKTAISVPDSTFERVDRKARELGMNRSEFYSRAAERYLDVLDDRALTAQIDDALLRSGDDSAREALEFARMSTEVARGFTADDEW
ncbi:MAG: ribbon-helix-helix protein, CopG family [Herbiconiux sp.]|nr:ribbon-helix-helix protein, CopG family [Herbiconiux sp.]